MPPALVAVIASLASLAGAPATDLESRVRAVITVSGAEVAVAFRTLDGRADLLIDADKSFHAASTMKVPVMIEDKKKSAALIAELSALVFEQANVVRMPVARK